MRTKTSRMMLLLSTAAVLIAGAAAASASTIGTNPPAEALTRSRIEPLPSRERNAWIGYLERSARQRQADKDSLKAELKRAGIEKPMEPPRGFAARSIPLDRDVAWYSTPEARHIAEMILLFQTPAGGWGKNLDMGKEPRHLGEAYAPDNVSKFLAPGDFDTPSESDWNYVGTIDNDATTTQMNFLAKYITFGRSADVGTYQIAFMRGMEYLFAAQYPNGGWPQVWPLEGGYHDAITYNDDAMAHVVELMRKVADARDEFSFVQQSIRDRAESSFGHGIQCILASQIVDKGTRTVWPQQADALTFKPVSGRNYELPAQGASESASLLLLLMNDLPHPTAAEQRAIRAAGLWFWKTAIYGQSWTGTSEGRELVDKPGAGPIWARYYQIGTDKPVFGDRDKSIHDNVSELSAERRNGYSWYSADAQRALDRFDKWSTEHPESK
jgi:PelA/Pel-15E family pectate lyase